MTNNPEASDLKDLPFLNKNLKRIDKAILKSLPPNYTDDEIDDNITSFNLGYTW